MYKLEKIEYQQMFPGLQWVAMVGQFPIGPTTLITLSRQVFPCILHEKMQTLIELYEIRSKVMQLIIADLEYDLLQHRHKLSRHS